MAPLRALGLGAPKGFQASGFLQHLAYGSEKCRGWEAGCNAAEVDGNGLLDVEPLHKQL